MKAYLLTSRIEGPEVITVFAPVFDVDVESEPPVALWSMGRSEAKWYFRFRAADIQARDRLICLSERLLAQNNFMGAWCLWNALVYLQDRAAYTADVAVRGIDGR